jgi:hypothetical protein
MSTKVPILHPSIPMPNDDPVSIVHSVLAIKQALEQQHDLSTSRPRVAKTAAGIGIAAAITHVTKTLP